MVFYVYKLQNPKISRSIKALTNLKNFVKVKITLSLRNGFSGSYILKRISSKLGMNSANI